MKIVYHPVIKFFLSHKIHSRSFLVITHRSSTASPMQLIQQSLRIYLRSYLQPYEQLKKCEQDILEIINREFRGQLGMIDDQQPFRNTLWLSNCTKIYSSWINRADKFLKDLNDLHESFRKVNFRIFLFKIFSFSVRIVY
jgi:hypothetical protein